MTGGSGETRTRDQRIKSPLLYRLSYRPSLMVDDALVEFAEKRVFILAAAKQEL